MVKIIGTKAEIIKFIGRNMMECPPNISPEQCNETSCNECMFENTTECEFEVVEDENRNYGQ